MPKNIKGTNSLANKNVQNSESIGNLTADTIRTTTLVATNATITNLTNEELQTNTTNIATLQSTVSANSTNIATNQGNISINQGNIATNTSDIATNTSNISTNTSDISTLQTSKQDLILDTTDLEFNRLDLNDRIFFQHNDGLNNKCSIRVANSNGRMTLTGNDYYFKDENNSNILVRFSDSGTVTATSIQADFFSSITDTELDYLDGVTSPVQTQLDSKQGSITAGDGLSFTGDTLNAEVTQTELDLKQDIITAGDGLSFTGNILNAEVTQAELDLKQDILTSSTAISVASMDLNSGDITNGGDGAFSTITLNGSDLQDKINDKANIFGVNLPLELDGTAFPNPALKLNYNTTEFQLNGSDELALTGSLPTLTSSLNCGVNSVSGITSLSVRSIELHNSTSGQSFLDFGGGDFRLRQIYNQTANTFTFLIDDATGENPEEKMQITRTEVNILNASLNLNDQDLIGAKYIQGDASIKFYVDGDTTGGTDFTLDLKTDGDADFNGGSLLNVEEVQNAVKFVEFGGSPNSATNNLWGNDGIHDVWSEGVNVNATGMVSQASGVFTINEAGTYTIDCNSSIEDVDYNGRIVAAQYISVNDDTTRFRLNPSSFALCYVRDDNFGVGGSLAFSTTIVLAQNDTIRFKTKLGKNSDNRAYDDTHSETGLNWWTGVRFRRHLIA